MLEEKNTEKNRRYSGKAHAVSETRGEREDMYGGSKKQVDEGNKTKAKVGDE